MVHLLLAVIYLSFISLGLPNSLLGTAWPSMHVQIGAPLSSVGGIYTLMSIGRIFSGLLSDRLTRRLGPGRLTAACVGITALTLFGFSVSGSYWQVCLWAVPYGFGAGIVDVVLNNYVAVHYKSRHVSWLHCMWGVGASVGPVVMSAALAGRGWPAGYRAIALLQFVLAGILLASLPLWKQSRTTQKHAEDAPSKNSLSLREVFSIPGVKFTILAFVCCCSLDQTMSLWISSYLSVYRGFSAQSASATASLYFFTIMLGRALSGFLTLKFTNRQLIRMGAAVLGAGLFLLWLPNGLSSYLGLFLIGLGYAPIFPCIVHSIPSNFGAARSQAILGVQSACGSLALCILPSLFGVLSAQAGLWLLPLYLGVILAVLIVMHERLYKILNKK